MCWNLHRQQITIRSRSRIASERTSRDANRRLDDSDGEFLLVLCVRLLGRDQRLHVVVLDERLERDDVSGLIEEGDCLGLLVDVRQLVLVALDLDLVEDEVTGLAQLELLLGEHAVAHDVGFAVTMLARLAVRGDRDLDWVAFDQQDVAFLNLCRLKSEIRTIANGSRT